MKDLVQLDLAKFCESKPKERKHKRCGSMIDLTHLDKKPRDMDRPKSSLDYSKHRRMRSSGGMMFKKS